MNITDWAQWLPPFDPQHSANNVADADDCVSESAVHIIETLIYQQTGKQVRYSPRALAKLAGTTLNGNDINTVLGAIRKYGLIPYELWPDLTNFTWDEYYADIPQNVIDAGKDFLAEWDVSNITTTADLSVAPIWLRVKAGSTFHFVEQFNATQIFDSYLPAVKPITTYEPVQTFQFTIKQKNQMKLIRDNGTIFLVSTDKTSKIGIGNQDVLTAFFPTEQITDGDTSHIPQAGTLADGVILHK